MTDETEEDREFEVLLEENERLVRERDVARAERDMLQRTITELSHTLREEAVRTTGLLRAGQEIKAALMGLMIWRDVRGGFSLRLPSRIGGYPEIPEKLSYTRVDDRECCCLLFERFEDADEALFSVVLKRIEETAHFLGSSRNGG